MSGKTFQTYNPATEEVIANVQEANAEDVDIAVAAARKAFEIGSEWRSMDPSTRGELMHKLAQLMRRDIEYLAVCYNFVFNHIIISFILIICFYFQEIGILEQWKAIF